MKYFFDFDGTLTNIWVRYYRVFIDALNLNDQYINFDEYKNMKKKLVNDDEIINKLGLHSETSLDEYHRKKRILLEDLQYLKYDSFIIKKKYIDSIFYQNCFVLTMRNNPDNFFKQLNILNAKALIDKSFIVKPSNGSKVKLSWLSKNCSEEFWIIGDSDNDLNVGEISNAHTCFVKTGLKSLETLNNISHTPDVICDDVNQFISNIYN